MSSYSDLNLRIIILELLKRTPMHGYQLAKETEQAFGKEPSRGALNPVLNSLEKEGLIRSFGNVECGRYKKIYSLTKKGEADLVDSKRKVLSFFKSS